MNKEEQKPKLLNVKVFIVELIVLLLFIHFIVAPIFILTGVPMIVQFITFFLLGWNWHKICPLFLPFMYKDKKEGK